MAEYIEREALEKMLNERLTYLLDKNGQYDYYTDGYDEAVSTVEEFLSADVAPVVHGRWKRYGKNLGECSECGEIVSARSYYCPNCGAKMDGGTT